MNKHYPFLRTPSFNFYISRFFCYNRYSLYQFKIIYNHSNENFHLKRSYLFDYFVIKQLFYNYLNNFL